MTVVPLPVGTTERWLDAPDGARLRRFERGDPDAQPLVLLHGITMQAATFTYQLRDLSERFHVVAMDLRGHGDSIAGNDGFGLDALARDLVLLLEELGRDDAIVLGHSMGAAVVMRFCRNHPAVRRDRVAGLVFVSAGPGFDLPERAERLLIGTNALGLRAVERLGFRLPYRFRGHRLSRALIRVSFGRSMSREHFEWTRAMAADVEPEAMWRSGFGMGDHDGIRAVRGLTTPSMVIVGSHDRLTPPRLARRLARSIGGARLEVVDGPGHQIMLEAPEALAALLVDFAASLQVRTGHG